jgi:hypothetical protein
VFFSPPPSPSTHVLPRRHSLVTRPPELCHCPPSSGEPRATADVVSLTSTARPYPVYSLRADHHQERCQGRAVYPYINEDPELSPTSFVHATIVVPPADAAHLHAPSTAATRAALSPPAHGQSAPPALASTCQPRVGCLARWAEVAVSQASCKRAAPGVAQAG